MYARLYSTPRRALGRDGLTGKTPADVGYKCENQPTLLKYTYAAAGRHPHQIEEHLGHWVSQGRSTQGILKRNSRRGTRKPGCMASFLSSRMHPTSLFVLFFSDTLPSSGSFFVRSFVPKAVVSASLQLRSVLGKKKKKTSLQQSDCFESES